MAQSSETMHAWRLAAYDKDIDKAIDSMTLETDVPVPSPEDGQVLVKVQYSSVNPIDWKLMNGDYHDNGIAPISQFPYTPGFDVVGTVVRAATGFNINDRVAANIGLLESCRDPAPLPGGPCGAWATMAVVPADRCVKLHDSTDLKTVAGIPLAGLTSYQALFHTKAGSTSLQGIPLGDVKEGTKVLVLGGSGGTGTLAVQMAKKAGAFVAATASATPISEGSEVTKIDLVEGLGADAVIDYKKDDWGEKFAGADYDVIFDCVGIPEDLTERAPKVLKKKDGVYVTIANFGGETTEDVPYAPFIVKSNSKDLQVLIDMAEKGDLIVPLDSEFEFADIKKALKRSRTGRSTGKILIKH